MTGDGMPRWPMRLIKLLCDPSLVDEIEGDMEEMYAQWLTQYGRSKARRLYIFHTLKFLRPFIFKRRKSSYPINQLDMTLNYFKIAWRNINRNRAFAIMNVLGLTLGVACVIIIYTLVTYHNSFDTYHPNFDRTYRMFSEFHLESISKWAAVPQPLGKAFANDFSFAEKIARVKSYNSVIVSIPGSADMPKFRERGTVAFAEPPLFEILHLPIVRGTSRNILSEPYTAVVTRSYAEKYFGTEDVIDKAIRINLADVSKEFKVVGVLDDLRPNTDIRIEVFLSYDNMKDFQPYFASDESWGSVNSGMNCYVTLKPGVSQSEVESALLTLVKKYYDESDAKVNVFKLQPLSDIHFNAELGGTFNKKYLWIFGMIGLFMLAIAAFNFINLAAAQILNRSKEVGVRKVLGSMRSHLFVQFIVETSLIATMAMVIGYGLAQLAVPFVNNLLKERLTISLVDHWQLPAFIGVVWFAVIVFSGTYPALLLTRFQPAAVLKSRLSAAPSGGFSLRRTLIVGQFMIAQLLIVCMLVIDEQVSYSVNSDLGFDKDAIVMMPIASRDATKMKTLMSRVAGVPGVQATTLCFDAPASASNSFTGLQFDDRPEPEPWEINLKDADENYISTFGLTLVAGRNLLPADTVREFMVNETTVRKLGFASPADIIGRKLFIDGRTFSGEIVGVVKDFYNLSFHEAISPVVFCTNPPRYRTLGVKIDMSHVSTAIDNFSRIWGETYSDNVFTYQFVDESIEAFYNNDISMLKMMQILSVIAIFIGCLGLYGLVSFMAVRKTKEIGVRKVLGAGIRSILWLFAKEFALLIAIAFVITVPVAWTVMNQWLQGFEYHIDVSPLSFTVAIFGTMIVAAITVSYHSMKAALADPVKSLRTE